MVCSDGRQPYHGFSASPLVEADTLIIESGGHEGKSFLGLDRTTGETRCTTGEIAVPGYNSALPSELGTLTSNLLPRKGATLYNFTIEAYPRRSLGQMPDSGVSGIRRPSARSMT
jgi:hypothetical protein